ncbi:unnamed protein product, partial [Amoebophrya sp. A120]
PGWRRFGERLSISNSLVLPGIGVAWPCRHHVVRRAYSSSSWARSDARTESWTFATALVDKIWAVLLRPLRGGTVSPFESWEADHVKAIAHACGVRSFELGSAANFRACAENACRDLCEDHAAYRRTYERALRPFVVDKVDARGNVILPLTDPVPSDACGQRVVDECRHYEETRNSTELKYRFLIGLLADELRVDTGAVDFPCRPPWEAAVLSWCSSSSCTRTCSTSRGA